MNEKSFALREHEEIFCQIEDILLSVFHTAICWRLEVQLVSQIYMIPFKPRRGLDRKNWFSYTEKECQSFGSVRYGKGQWTKRKRFKAETDS